MDGSRQRPRQRRVMSQRASPLNQYEPPEHKRPLVVLHWADRDDGGVELPGAMDRREAILARAIGAEAARRREARGWSQTELAAVGCDRWAVSRWEARRRPPSLPHLAALGRVLGCGACALLPTD